MSSDLGVGDYRRYDLTRGEITPDCSRDHSKSHVTEHGPAPDAHTHHIRSITIRYTPRSPRWPPLSYANATAATATALATTDRAAAACASAYRADARHAALVAEQLLEEAHGDATGSGREGGGHIHALGDTRVAGWGEAERGARAEAVCARSRSRTRTRRVSTRLTTALWAAHMLACSG